MTKDQALSKVERHEAMRELFVRATGIGMRIEQSRDSRGVVVRMPSATFGPSFRDEVYASTLVEVLDAGPDMFDFLEVSDRVQEAVLGDDAGDETARAERMAEAAGNVGSSAEASPAARRMPWWLSMAIAGTLAVVTGQLLGALLQDLVVSW